MLLSLAQIYLHLYVSSNKPFIESYYGIVGRSGHPKNDQAGRQVL